MGGKAPTQAGLGDVWVFHVAARAWRQARLTGSGVPLLRRCAHGATLLEDQPRLLILHGGLNSAGQFSAETLTLNTVSGDTRLLHLSGSAPSARAYHTLQALGPYVVVTGGRVGNPETRELAAKGASCYFMDLRTKKWAPLRASGAEPLRCNAAAAVLPAAALGAPGRSGLHGMVLHGGITRWAADGRSEADGTRMADAHILRLQIGTAAPVFAWLPLLGAEEGTAPRSMHAVACWPAGPRAFTLLVSGGFSGGVTTDAALLRTFSMAQLDAPSLPVQPARASAPALPAAMVHESLPASGGFQAEELSQGQPGWRSKKRKVPEPEGATGKGPLPLLTAAEGARVAEMQAAEGRAAAAEATAAAESRRAAAAAADVAALRARLATEQAARAALAGQLEVVEAARKAAAEGKIAAEASASAAMATMASAERAREQAEGMARAAHDCELTAKSRADAAERRAADARMETRRTEAQIKEQAQGYRDDLARSAAALQAMQGKEALARADADQARLEVTGVRAAKGQAELQLRSELNEAKAQRDGLGLENGQLRRDLKKTEEEVERLKAADFKRQEELRRVQHARVAAEDTVGKRDEELRRLHVQQASNRKDLEALRQGGTAMAASVLHFQDHVAKMISRQPLLPPHAHHSGDGGTQPDEAGAAEDAPRHARRY